MIYKIYLENLHIKSFILTGSLLLYLHLGNVLYAQTFNEIDKIVASDRFDNASFGNACDIYQTTAIVGAQSESKDSNGQNQLLGAGAAYIFENINSGICSETQKIVASDRSEFSNFGESVSIDEDYAIVGAYRDDFDESGSNAILNAGSAYLFKRNSSGGWEQQQKIVASNRAENSEFGVIVSISGSQVIVGSSSGSAYIFEKNASNIWTETANLINPDETGAGFGDYVDIWGNCVVIGSPNADLDANGQNPISSAGAAFIYDKNASGNWELTQKIDGLHRDAEDRFGYSVAIDNNFIVVGAFADDEDENGGNPINAAGSAFIFEKNSNGIWQRVQKIVASNRGLEDTFGGRVSISGNIAIVSSLTSMIDPVTSQVLLKGGGSVYVFSRNGNGVWNEEQELMASDREPYDFFSISSSIYGNTIIVGALDEDEDCLGNNTLNNSGSSYLYSDPTLGNEINTKIDKIVAFPNPAKTNVFLSGVFKGVNTTFSIFDIQGKLLNSETIEQNKINTSDLAAGIYFITIRNDYQSQTIKLLIEN
tara:strand:+ start:177 stop:1790 length:1614 start_codon:yes stop_codon:yes gene_type:complete